MVVIGASTLSSFDISTSLVEVPSECPCGFVTSIHFLTLASNMKNLEGIQELGVALMMYPGYDTIRLKLECQDATRASHGDLVTKILKLRKQSNYRTFSGSSLHLVVPHHLFNLCRSRFNAFRDFLQRRFEG